MNLPLPKVDISRLTSRVRSARCHLRVQRAAARRHARGFYPHRYRAREFLRGLYEAAGLKVRVDAVGNTFARWEGTDNRAPIVGTGSHTDAIPHAGMYDGTVGVLGGLEAIRALQQSGFRPLRSIELVMFTSEEPTRFGVGCTGSRLMSGATSPEQLALLTDEAGDSYDTIRRGAGFEGAIASAVLPDNYYHAFVELHIEQGPLLEQAGVPIGVVTAIAAPATVEFTVRGEGGHAGAVLMDNRRDALAAAAQMIVAIEASAQESRAPTWWRPSAACRFTPGRSTPSPAVCVSRSTSATSTAGIATPCSIRLGAKWSVLLLPARCRSHGTC